MTIETPQHGRHRNPRPGPPQRLAGGSARADCALSARAMGGPRQSRRDGAFLAVAPRHVPRTVRRYRATSPRNSATATCRRRTSRASWCRGCNSCCRSSTCITRSRTCIIFRFFAPPRSGWRAASTCWKATTTPSTPTWRRPPRPPTRCCARWPATPTLLARCGDDYAQASGALIKGLIRHLDDEEDLIVPLILDRGEEALGVAHQS